jgi:hypothetical protein
MALFSLKKFSGVLVNMSVVLLTKKVSFVCENIIYFLKEVVSFIIYLFIFYFYFKTKVKNNYFLEKYLNKF